MMMNSGGESKTLVEIAPGVKIATVNRKWDQ